MRILLSIIFKTKNKSCTVSNRKIAVTTLTNVERKSNDGFYKKGDLTIILSNIAIIPYALITVTQWRLCCDAGYLPVDFISKTG